MNRVLVEHVLFAFFVSKLYVTFHVFFLVSFFLGRQRGVMKNLPRTRCMKRIPLPFRMWFLRRRRLFFMEITQGFLEQRWNSRPAILVIFWCFLRLGFPEKVGDTTFLDWKWIWTPKYLHLWKLLRCPLKRGHFKRKGSSPRHYFQGTC